MRFRKITLRNQNKFELRHRTSFFSLGEIMMFRRFFAPTKIMSDVRGCDGHKLSNRKFSAFLFRRSIDYVRMSRGNPSFAKPVGIPVVPRYVIVLEKKCRWKMSLSHIFVVSMYLQHPQGDFPRPPRARSPAGADQQLCVRVCAGQGRARLWQHGPGEREQQ